MRWRGRCDPHLHIPLAAGGAPYGPVAVDEAPIAADPFGKLSQIDVSRPLARRAGEERAHAVVDELPERIDRDGVVRLVHRRMVHRSSAIVHSPRAERPLAVKSLI